MHVVYFSNVTENTHKFVQKLHVENSRIPFMWNDATPFIVPETITGFILIVPTYENKNRTDFLPRQVKKFLAIKENRDRVLAVIAGGNINFGPDYAKAGDVVRDRLSVPFLTSFELAGTDIEIDRVKSHLMAFEACQGDMAHYDAALLREQAIISDNSQESEVMTPEERIIQAIQDPARRAAKREELAQRARETGYPHRIGRTFTPVTPRHLQFNLVLVAGSV